MNVLLHERRALLCLKKTPVILHALLKNATAEQVKQLTDGPGGWNVTQVLCHLRDFESIFLGRLRQMAEQDNPAIQPADPAAIEREGDYANAVYEDALNDFIARRRETIAYLETLSQDQWPRAGRHPEQQDYTVISLATMIPLHDVDHLEQIARILGLAESL